MNGSNEVFVSWRITNESIIDNKTSLARSLIISVAQDSSVHSSWEVSSLHVNQVHFEKHRHKCNQ